MSAIDPVTIEFITRQLKDILESLEHVKLRIQKNDDITESVRGDLEQHRITEGAWQVRVEEQVNRITTRLEDTAKKTERHEPSVQVVADTLVTVRVLGRITGALVFIGGVISSVVYGAWKIFEWLLHASPPH